MPHLKTISIISYTFLLITKLDLAKCNNRDKQRKRFIKINSLVLYAYSRN